ncbi:Uncharacterised protein [Mycobacterium tuberculosis]|uniref:Uncharacterized protein n=1 Tax=Mycobacterium tuberculosis TaxID=1773 RepID=A0A0T9CJL4_MYCTX|nr:Uncharacterised protein [Mycobacterium tuberculosis]CKP54837.1 Uncharacterised protein [Mycobacterium tuberculosis]CKR46265.1 Uncharacterised protein [Mycobacterium tuberculosis]CKR67695.1 Uncharacterised protein [Mycobacterium tuberculosis]CKS62448.1 Uncharacterised protein [Mycobacterium tuberculosis]
MWSSQIFSASVRGSPVCKAISKCLYSFVRDSLVISKYETL